MEERGEGKSASDVRQEHRATGTVLARLYAPPRINAPPPPPLRGLSYCAGFLSRKHAPPPPPPRSD